MSSALCFGFFLIFIFILHRSFLTYQTIREWKNTVYTQVGYCVIFNHKWLKVVQNNGKWRWRLNLTFIYLSKKDHMTVKEFGLDKNNNSKALFTCISSDNLRDDFRTILHEESNFTV